MLCRLCLKSSTVLHNIITSDLKCGNLTLLESLYWIFGVDIDVNDNYSKFICVRCENVIEYIGCYRTLYQRNQLILQQKLDDQDERERWLDELDESDIKNGFEITRKRKLRNDKVIETPEKNSGTDSDILEITDEKEHTSQDILLGLHTNAKRRRLKFIECYYKTSTSAIRELIKDRATQISTENINQNFAINIKEEEDDDQLFQVNEEEEVIVCKFCSRMYKTKKHLDVHYESKHKSKISADKAQTIKTKRRRLGRRFGLVKRSRKPRPLTKRVEQEPSTSSTILDPAIIGKSTDELSFDLKKLPNLNSINQIDIDDKKTSQSSDEIKTVIISENGVSIRYINNQYKWLKLRDFSIIVEKIADASLSEHNKRLTRSESSKGVTKVSITLPKKQLKTNINTNFTKEQVREDQEGKEIILRPKNVDGNDGNSIVMNTSRNHVLTTLQKIQLIKQKMQTVEIAEKQKIERESSETDNSKGVSDIVVREEETSCPSEVVSDYEREPFEDCETSGDEVESEVEPLATTSNLKNIWQQHVTTSLTDNDNLIISVSLSTDNLSETNLINQYRWLNLKNFVIPVDRCSIPENYYEDKQIIKNLGTEAANKKQIEALGKNQLDNAVDRDIIILNKDPQKIGQQETETYSLKNKEAEVQLENKNTQQEIKPVRIGYEIFTEKTQSLPENIKELLNLKDICICIERSSVPKQYYLNLMNGMKEELLNSEENSIENVDNVEVSSFLKESGEVKDAEHEVRTVVLSNNYHLSRNQKHMRRNLNNQYKWLNLKDFHISVTRYIMPSGFHGLDQDKQGNGDSEITYESNSSSVKENSLSNDVKERNIPESSLTVQLKSRNNYSEELWEVFSTEYNKISETEDFIKNLDMNDDNSYDMEYQNIGSDLQEDSGDLLINRFCENTSSEEEISKDFRSECVENTNNILTPHFKNFDLKNVCVYLEKCPVPEVNITAEIENKICDYDGKERETKEWKNGMSNTGRYLPKIIDESQTRGFDRGKSDQSSKHNEDSITEVFNDVPYQEQNELVDKETKTVSKVENCPILDNTISTDKIEDKMLEMQKRREQLSATLDKINRIRQNKVLQESLKILDTESVKEEQNEQWKCLVNNPAAAKSDVEGKKKKKRRNKAEGDDINLNRCYALRKNIGVPNNGSISKKAEESTVLVSQSRKDNLSVENLEVDEISNFTQQVPEKGPSTVSVEVNVNCAEVPNDLRNIKQGKTKENETENNTVKKIVNSLKSGIFKITEKDNLVSVEIDSVQGFTSQTKSGTEKKFPKTKICEKVDLEINTLDSVELNETNTSNDLQQVTTVLANSDINKIDKDQFKKKTAVGKLSKGLESDISRESLIPSNSNSSKSAKKNNKKRPKSYSLADQSNSSNCGENIYTDQDERVPAIKTIRDIKNVDLEQSVSEEKSKKSQCLKHRRKSLSKTKAEKEVRLTKEIDQLSKLLNLLKIIENKGVGCKSLNESKNCSKNEEPNPSNTLLTKSTNESKNEEVNHDINDNGISQKIDEETRKEETSDNIKEPQSDNTNGVTKMENPWRKNLSATLHKIKRIKERLGMNGDCKKELTNENKNMSLNELQVEIFANTEETTKNKNEDVRTSTQLVNTQGSDAFCEKQSRTSLDSDNDDCIKYRQESSLQENVSECSGLTNVENGRNHITSNTDDCVTKSNSFEEIEHIDTVTNESKPN